MIIVSRADLGSANFVSELDPFFRRNGQNVELYRNVRGTLLRYYGTQAMSAIGLHTSLEVSGRYSTLEGIFWSEEFIRISSLDTVNGFTENVYVSTAPVLGVPEVMRTNPGLVLSDTVGSLHPGWDLDSKDA